MSDVKTAVAYKDSNGVDKFGVVEEVNDKLSRYCITPFSADEEVWVSKDRAVRFSPEDLNEVFIQTKLDSAVNMADDGISLTSTDVRDRESSEEDNSSIMNSETLDIDLNPNKILDMDSVAGSLLEDKNWTVGRVCVCRWDEDNRWYFAVVTTVSPKTRTCDVRFLYYNNSQRFVPIDRLHPVTSKTISWVGDSLNTRHAYKLLTAANWPIPRNSSREEDKTGECEYAKKSREEKEAASKDKRRKHGNSQRFKSEGKLNVSEISHFWLSLLAKKYESENSTIPMLIFKQYKLGYDVGFEMAMKTKRYRKD